MKAIPTSYRGTNFRSRIEARWAVFFDLVEWPWEYEPIDLEGYIPDFILTFDRPLLVEVKSALTLPELYAHTPKVDASGWHGEALIVGARLFQSEQFGDCLSPGILREGGCSPESEPGWSTATIGRAPWCSNDSGGTPLKVEGPAPVHCIHGKGCWAECGCGQCPNCGRVPGEP